MIIINIVPYKEYESEELPLGQFIEINNSKVRYSQIGTGNDVLFIHGMPGMIEIFDPLKKYLQNDFRLTSYDRPGYGYSSIKNNEFTLEYNAEIAIELINRLNLRNVTLVGYSYGGPIAIVAAIKNPELINNVVLIGTARLESGKKSELPAFVNIMTNSILGKSLALLLKYTAGPKMVNGVLTQGYIPNEDKFSKELLEESKKMWLQAKTLVTITKEIKNTPNDIQEFEKKLDTIETKVIIIHGEGDIINEKENAIHADMKLPNSELILIENSGHFVHYVFPEKIASIILKYVK